MGRRGRWGGGGGGGGEKELEESGGEGEEEENFAAFPDNYTRICRDYFQVHKVNALGNSSLVPRSAHRFRLHERTRRPGMFPHVRDVEGRKVVERT